MGRKFSDLDATAFDLGAEFVERELGVAMQPGGEHSRMGTHNLLLRLGDAAYLEVISINPYAPNPGRPRWFDLDYPDTMTEPRLCTCVARTSSIRDALSATREDLGPVEVMSRGDMEWQITTPSDGRPPLDGTVPALIEWSGGPHPASQLPDAGCTFLRLEAYHPEPAGVSAVIDCLGLHDTISVRPLPPGVRGYLAAYINTPTGQRCIATPNHRLDRP